MSRRDIIGAVLLAVLLIFLGGILIWTFARPSGSIHDPKDSIFVRQRIINLQKSAQ